MRKIWLDTDPGFDDWFAMALLADNPSLEWLGTSIVAGNAPLEMTWRNARRIAAFHSLGVPMFAGCDAPLVAPLITGHEVLGADGMRTTGEPLPAVVGEDDRPAVHGVDALISAVLHSPGELTIVAIGPLTNIALALQREPKLAGAIAEIVLMGGSADGGNMTAAAEYNIYADPEAAAIVFDSGVPLRMFGLNLCRQFCITATDVDRVRSWPGEKARCFAGYLDAYLRIADPKGRKWMPIFDASVSAWLRWPELFTFQPARVDIELEGRFTRGMTVCDFRAHRATPQVQVAMWVDGREAMARAMGVLERVLDGPLPS
jgi:purine nucleosidase